jgi:hypothetical protein
MNFLRILIALKFTFVKSLIDTKKYLNNSFVNEQKKL